MTSTISMRTTRAKTAAMMRIEAFLLAGLLVGSGPAFAASPEAPSLSAREVAEQTIAAVLVVLNEQGASEESRRDRIAAIAYEHFDFDTMSKLVIARPWRKFTKPQRAEFIAEFKTHLARSYGRRLSRYEGVNLEVVGEGKVDARGEQVLPFRGDGVGDSRGDT